MAPEEGTVLYDVMFQSAPPAWGVIDAEDREAIRKWVSIRTPRVGGDRVWGAVFPRSNRFNPHPPRGG